MTDGEVVLTSKVHVQVALDVIGLVVERDGGFDFYDPVDTLEALLADIASADKAEQEESKRIAAEQKKQQEDQASSAVSSMKNSVRNSSHKDKPNDAEDQRAVE